MSEKYEEEFEKSDKGWICGENFKQIKILVIGFFRKVVNPENTVNNI